MNAKIAAAPAKAASIPRVDAEDLCSGCDSVGPFI